MSESPEPAYVVRNAINEAEGFIKAVLGFDNLPEFLPHACLLMQRLRNKMKYSIPAAMSALALAVTSAALAETPVQQRADIEETIVTASLLPIEPARIASAYTVIDREAIDNRSPLLVSDLLRNVPGMAVSRNGVLGSSTQVRVRGAEANHLLVLIDGVEANDPGQGDEFNWGTLTASDVERIEVIRGPQSALYGSDAVAGVVNIITRDAEEPFSAGIFSEAGSFNTYSNGVNLAVQNDQYSVRLGASHLESDGDNISRTGDEEDGYENTTLSLKGRAKLTDNFSLTLSARQQDGENEFDLTDFSTGLPGDADAYTEFLSRTGGLSADISTLDGHWQHRLTARYSRNENDNFSYGASSGTNATTKNQYQYLSSINWADKSQSLTFLFEREEEDFEQRGTAQPWGDPNQDRERDTDSVGAEYRGTYFDKLTLSASARFDDNSEFDSAETYKLEGAWQLTGTSRLRAVWGTAVKNPTFSERYGFFTNFLGNPNLIPEESTSWELGLDQSLFEDKLLVSLTWFDAELEDEINGFVWNNDYFAYTAENVDGTSERQGVEVEVTALLSESVQLSGSYTYTDSEQEDGLGGEMEELRRAKHLASVTLGWDISNKLQFNLNAQYNGEQKDEFFPPYPQPSEILTLDDYTLVNLNLNYSATDQLALYVKVENALDEDYEEVFGYQTLGVGGYVGIRYQFSQ